MRIVAIHKGGDRQTPSVAIGTVGKESEDGTVAWVRVMEWNGVPVPPDKMEGLAFYYNSWLTDMEVMTI